MKKIFLLIFLIQFAFLLQAQNKVSFTQNGKTINVACKSKAFYQNVNGKISLNITTKNNQLLELNNIDEKLFIGNARRISKSFKIVLIDHANNITYTSSTAVQVLINCLKNSDNYMVSFSGLVASKSKKINVSSTLFVIKTPKQNIQTN